MVGQWAVTCTDSVRSILEPMLRSLSELWEDNAMTVDLYCTSLGNVLQGSVGDGRCCYVLTGITSSVRPFFITVRSLSLTAYRSLKQFEILPILTICNYVQIYFDQVATVNFIGGPVVARPSDGWTAGTARTFCADYLTASQAVTRCQGIPGVNIASSEDQCTDDVMVRKIIVNRSIIILMIN